MDNYLVGDKLCALFELLVERRYDIETKRKIGRLWREIASIPPLPMILVEIETREGAQSHLSFPDRAAFARHIKTLHPSLAEETDEAAIEWYARKFAALRILDGREEMTV